MSDPLDIYLARIQADLRGGKATELTYRSALEELLEALAPGVNATSDPRHIACGAPSAPMTLSITSASWWPCTKPFA